MTLELISDIFNHLDNTSTPTLRLTHFVFSKKAGIASEGETLVSDNREMDRKAITISRQGKYLALSCEIDNDTANCETQNIDAVISNTELTLNDAVSFEIDNLIDIKEVSGWKERRIIAKAGNTITLNEPVTTSVNNKVREKISRIAIVYNGTPTRLSGKVLKWFSYVKFKDSSMSFNLAHKLELKV